MPETDPTTARRLYWARRLSDDFTLFGDAKTRAALKLPSSTDVGDSLGISKIWGFTTRTLIGAAFYYCWRWHDMRQKLFDLPVAKADSIVLSWAKYIADNWPNIQERRRLQFALNFGGLIKLWGLLRWRILGGKA